MFSQGSADMGTTPSQKLALVALGALYQYEISPCRRSSIAPCRPSRGDQRRFRYVYGRPPSCTSRRQRTPECASVSQGPPPAISQSTSVPRRAGSSSPYLLFQPSPCPDSPLWARENIICTPASAKSAMTFSGQSCTRAIGQVGVSDAGDLEEPLRRRRRIVRANGCRRNREGEPEG